MDFYLSDSTGHRMQFTMNPVEVSLQDGPRVESYSVVALGQISTPRGQTPSVISWDGVLAGAGRKDQPYVKSWQDPLALDKQLRTWANGGATLKLLVTNTPINLSVYISKFTSKFSGGLGDIKYSIELTERRQIKVGTSGAQASTTSASAARARSKTPSGNTYTVKPGDTLWGIAKKLSGNGANYKALYTLNQSTIGSDPNLIKVGQVLRVPVGW